MLWDQSSEKEVACGEEFPTDPPPIFNCKLSRPGSHKWLGATCWQRVRGATSWHLALLSHTGDNTNIWGQRLCLCTGTGAPPTLSFGSRAL